MDMQVRGLRQKYMGATRPGPNDHAKAIFNYAGYEAESAHPVPVSNFMNAQCEWL